MLLHANATVGWLRVAGASIELREQAAELATRAAEARDTPEARGLAVWGGLHVLVAAGAIDLARDELDSVSVPTRTPEGMQLAGTLALCRSFLAAVDSRPADMDAPLEYAAELAQRSGEINAYGLGFGPGLSMHITLYPSRSRRSHRCDPRKPAPPVTTAQGRRVIASLRPRQKQYIFRRDSTEPGNDQVQE